MKSMLFPIARTTWLRALVALGAALFALSSVTPAHAVGRVTWKSTTIKERTKNGSWRLEMSIFLPRAPDIAHKSMKFEFTQKSEFERALVDGRESPQTRTVPLSNMQPIIESQTVGFLDPGSGEIQSRTRFSFKVTRAHGYNAGVWQVKIKDGDTGRQIGSVTTLRLEGENPVIDRRSIVFHGNDKKKDKKEEQEADSTDDSAEEAAPVEEAEAAPVEEEAMEEPSEGEGQVPPSIEEKPGGGCHYAPSPREPLWLLVGLLLGAFVVARRRT